MQILLDNFIEAWINAIKYHDKIMKGYITLGIQKQFVSSLHNAVELCLKQKMLDKNDTFVAEIKIKDKEDAELSKYYFHSIGHSLGLDVHDPSIDNLGLLEGMVITIEPGLYIPDENIGIRIEDNIVITKDDLVKELTSYSYEFLTPSNKLIRKTIVPFLFEVKKEGNPIPKEERMISVKWMEKEEFIEKCTHENVKDIVKEI